MSDSNGNGGMGIIGMIIGAVTVAFLFLGGIIFVLALLAWPIWLILLLNLTFGDPEMLKDNDTNREWRAHPGARANSILLNWAVFGAYSLLLFLFALFVAPGIFGFFN